MMELCCYCAEPIKTEAVRCPHCHAWLVPWSYRHKGFPAFGTFAAGVYIIVDCATNLFVSNAITKWILYPLAVILILVGLFYWSKTTQTSWAQGKRELFERLRKPPKTEIDEEFEDDDDEEDDEDEEDSRPNPPQSKRKS